MNNENLLNDVRDVNLSYLLLMQRLISADREMAMFRLNIDEEMADLFSTVPVRELARIAGCNQLLCQFSPGSSSQLGSALVDVPQDNNMRQVNAPILISGREEPNNNRRQVKRTTDLRKSYRRKRSPSNHEHVAQQ